MVADNVAVVENSSSKGTDNEISLEQIALSDAELADLIKDVAVKA